MKLPEGGEGFVSIKVEFRKPIWRNDSGQNDGKIGRALGPEAGLIK